MQSGKTLSSEALPSVSREQTFVRHLVGERSGSIRLTRVSVWELAFEQSMCTKLQLWSSALLDLGTVGREPPLSMPWWYPCCVTRASESMSLSLHFFICNMGVAVESNKCASPPGSSCCCLFRQPSLVSECCCLVSPHSPHPPFQLQLHKG